MKIPVSLCFIVLIGSQVFGQSPFKNLVVSQFGDSILVNWTLSGGSTCFDMHLMRASQGSDFGEVFSVPGVCGGADDQYYDFIDTEELVSGTTYEYMVTASNGVYESETVSILFINAGDVQLFVYPNPSQTEIQVTIDNKFTPAFFVELYTVDGKLMQQSREVSNLFSINTTALPPNGYLLKIVTQDGDILAQQFIVQ